jgi:cell division protein FtsB
VLRCARETPVRGAINPVLSRSSHLGGMVTRKRLRSFLTALGLYVLAALLIGYFGVNAYSGDRGIKAKEDIDRQITALSTQLDQLKLDRAQWERRVALLRSSKLDPDMLDEQARALLDDVSPSDLTLMYSTWRPTTANPPKP